MFTSTRAQSNRPNYALNFESRYAKNGKQKKNENWRFTKRQGSEGKHTWSGNKGAAEKVRGVPWAPSLPALSPAVTLLRSLLPLISELSPPPGPGAPTAPRVTIGLSSTSPRHVPSKRMNDAVCYYPDHLTHRCTIREYVRPFDGCSRYENQQM